MSWIRIETSLPRSPKMHRLARLLQIDRMQAIGLALTWLAWLDEQTVDGCSGLTPEELDGMLGVPGASDALQRIGWCEVDDAGEVRAVDWEQYNGESAKKRALTARRVERSRIKSRSCNANSVTEFTENAETCNASCVTSALAREDKNIYSSHTHPRVRACACEGAEGMVEEPTLEEVVSIVGRMPYGNMDASEREKCANAFLQSMRARGWLDVRGFPVCDWTAAANVYAQRWAENLAKEAAREASRQAVADERTALMAKDVESKIAERRQRMDPTLRPRMDCNYGANYEM